MREELKRIVNKYTEGIDLLDYHKKILINGSANEIFIVLANYNINHEQKIIDLIEDLIPYDLIINDWLLSFLSKELLINVLEYLFENGYNIYSLGDYDGNLLFKIFETARYSYDDSNFNIFKTAINKLIELKVDYKLICNDGRNILHKAVREGATNLTLAFVANLDVDVNKQDKYGYTPLHYAAENISYEQISILLDNGAAPSKSLKTLTRNLEDIPMSAGITPLEVYKLQAPEDAHYHDLRVVDLLK